MADTPLAGERGGRAPDVGAGERADHRRERVDPQMCGVPGRQRRAELPCRVGGSAAAGTEQRDDECCGQAHGVRQAPSSVEAAERKAPSAIVPATMAPASALNTAVAFHVGAGLTATGAWQAVVTQARPPNAVPASDPAVGVVMYGMPARPGNNFRRHSATVTAGFRSLPEYRPEGDRTSKASSPPVDASITAGTGSGLAMTRGESGESRHRTQ